MHRLVTHLPALACALVLALPATGSAQEPSPAPAPNPAPNTAPQDFVVQPGDHSIDLALDGLLVPARTRKIAFAPTAFAGSAMVANVLPSGSSVSAGNLVIELECEDLERELKRAAADLDAAQTEMDLFDAETAVREDEQTHKIEDLESRLTRTVREQESFEKYSGPRMLEGSALGVRRSEYNIADQKEELAQLEGMYKQSQLSSETQEIVLQRARRDVATAEKSLELTRVDAEVTRLYTHPDRGRELAQNVDSRASELARERESIRIAQARRVLERIRARQKLQDAADRLERLRRDHEGLRCSAPASGVLVHSLDPGDPVKPGQILATLQEVDRLQIALDVDAAALRVLAEGSVVRIVPEEFPDLALDGKVARIGAAGKASEAKGKPARFPVEISLGATQSLLRAGLRCQVSVAGLALKNVLAVPRKAVFSEGGASFVRVREGDAIAKRRVALGLGNAELAHVVDGLEPGDTVLLEPPAGEKK